jgi:hypothetical protein
MYYLIKINISLFIYQNGIVLLPTWETIVLRLYHLVKHLMSTLIQNQPVCTDHSCLHPLDLAIRTVQSLLLVVTHFSLKLVICCVK